MGEPVGWRGRARSGAVGWASSRSYREYGLMAGLAVLLVSGAFGGLRDTPEESPTLVPRTAVEVAPFTVSVERVRVGRDLGVGSIGKPAGRYLLVSARVSTDDTASVPYQALLDLVRLEGAQGLVPPSRRAGAPLPDPATVAPRTIVSTDDAEPMGDIAPGLTYPVAFLFEQAPSAPTPDEVTVVLDAHTWRKSFIEERMGWFDPTPAARGAFPVLPYEPAPDPSPSASTG
ncbi:hypothetical protein [Phycicoccus sonneratiae]|uniref:DUF4352 domain-containing protein n=1 Tax=Phycicoccus sonneratiae TaxID=2807628 RepID=A0ABS2CL33_9MICO|nr:hypothetical protein [Phycicoccus sonneraticus]MBM6400538.1 hypothetical protein [Phycicoccus sonneraticus]